MKKFEDLMTEVCVETRGVRSRSFVSIMNLLFTERTKEMLLNSGLSGKEIDALITGSVQEIEHGSMETVDRLVRRKLSAGGYVFS